ncbi:protein trichome birefringence-like 25 isoform X2 [Dioscorea cayenensis subsp. rotundata]|uniref:Protein trichome birefringence-like 25 isoform X2 n=1 Tax=Dioscorea cayennensis subsp. rotundata TaxID=55577 RepID=A0AB40CHD8_DIOCR|nr:protein trichome birefringence-like 25 isoform X2 [Dioscorea cayenensis subsp. rotundata]
MADEAEVGDYEPLHHANEGRSSISLIFFKFFGVVFLAGALCYLFISNFNAWTMEAKKLSLSLEKQDALSIRPLMKESIFKEQQQLKKDQVCDLSVGEWIPNSAGPAYTNETCNKIPTYLNCLKNGRPDTGYLHWRWKPSGCDSHPIDPLKFLNAMRNKSIAFLGASICHNHVVSLICQLSKVEEALDIFHDSSFQTRTWYYPSYNLTLYVIWAPFLIHYETIDNPGDKSQSELHIHLDILDNKWTSEYNKYDYVVITGGADFYRSTIIYENNQVIGCHHCRPHMKLKHLAADEIYRKALKLSLKFIATAEHKAFIILRTWPPMHYEHGELPDEKFCNRTKPFREDEISGYASDHKMREVEIEECEKAATIGAKNGVRIELLDTYHLSLLRPDGHPGSYGIYNPSDSDKKKEVQYDCVHWCLPGPIDTWAELLVLKMLSSGVAGDSVSA